MTLTTEQLRAVEPRQAAAWMLANGWTLVGGQPERVAVYRKASIGD